MSASKICYHRVLFLTKWLILDCPLLCNQKHQEQVKHWQNSTCGINFYSHYPHLVCVHAVIALKNLLHGSRWVKSRYQITDKFDGDLYSWRDCKFLIQFWHYLRLIFGILCSSYFWDILKSDILITNASFLTLCLKQQLSWSVILGRLDISFALMGS